MNVDKNDIGLPNGFLFLDVINGETKKVIAVRRQNREWYSMIVPDELLSITIQLDDPLINFKVDKNYIHFIIHNENIKMIKALGSYIEIDYKNYKSIDSLRDSKELENYFNLLLDDFIENTTSTLVFES